MLEAGRAVVPVALEQPRPFLPRLQLAANGPAIPAAQNTPPFRHALPVPKGPEQFLARPRPAGLELLPLEPRQRRRPVRRQVFRALKPPLFAPAQSLLTHFQPAPGFGLAPRVEGGVHVADQGKGIRHDLPRRAGQRRQRRVEKGFP